MENVKIIGTGRSLPEKIMTNFDLEKIVDTNDEWIRTRTGISERRIALESEATSDFATKAAIKALEMANIKAEDLDLIIVATITPDMGFPATACIVQDNIGALNAAAFDLEAACSGFLYGVTVGKQFIKTGVYKYVLVIGAETMSKILDFEDRNTCVLFGDGAGAAILGVSDDDSGIKSFEIGADGSGGKYLDLPAGGSRKPASVDTVTSREHYVRMEGNEVFKFAVRKMGSASLNVIKKAGLEISDIDFLVPHQANIRIINSAAKKLKLPLNKVEINLDKYGNTSAASIPMALDQAVRENKIKKGDNVVLVGFGGGLTWGACMIKW
ncbi:beta-ketoacyl-ACP synthase III [Helicovermis profundi]|uniref:Beta-ketoacyl-[acyl-carrier-protein] synthase III n=1 Tax=Helicovermis profundi TaxID=3065157 RepID=A0AAU9E496_9FIRM|nr:ketoacyl-ACP synthase III [Clostridia bacterium S502]